MLALIVFAVAALTISGLLEAAWIGNRIQTVPSDHLRGAHHPDGSVAIDKSSPPKISERTPVAGEPREPELEVTAFARERTVEAVVEAKRGRPASPIRLVFDDPGAFDPEDTHAMGVAFERACQSLGIPDKTTPMAKAMAILIIDAGMTGERNAARLYEAAMRWAPNAA